MSSLILRNASTVLKPLLLLFSILVLLRGHYEPGGGFVGGLVAAAAFAFVAIGSGVREARRSLRVPPHALFALGLLVAIAGGLIPMALGRPFLTSVTLPVSIPGAGELKLSTVLLFDAGVYLVVLGVVLTIVFNLAEEE